MANTFYIKRGATAPDLETILSDENGIVDLTNATGVVLRMKIPFGSFLDKSASILDQTDPDNLGKIRVENIAKDGLMFDLPPGEYNAEFRVTYSNGKIAIFPTEASEYDNAVYNKIVIQNAIS